jgi:hypothetical protein
MICPLIGRLGRIRLTVYSSRNVSPLFKLNFIPWHLISMREVWTYKASMGRIHCSKNQLRYRFISQFIVNRVVTDKILAYRPVYRASDISADFPHESRYFAPFSLSWPIFRMIVSEISMKFGMQSIFSSYGFLEFCISSNFIIDSNARNQGNTYVQFSNIFFLHSTF